MIEGEEIQLIEVAVLWPVWPQVPDPVVYIRRSGIEVGARFEITGTNVQVAPSGDWEMILAMRRIKDT